MANTGPLCHATRRHQLLSGENWRGSDSTQHRGGVREKHLCVQQLFTFYSDFSLLTSSLVEVGWHDRFFFFFFTAFILADNENGEKSVQQAPSNPVPPNVPPKPGTVSCIKRQPCYLHLLRLPDLLAVTMWHLPAFGNSTPTSAWFHFGVF